VIAPNVIQADIVADAKSAATITALLASASEVRESEYQGADWHYPTIRVAIISHFPITGPEPCDLAALTLAFRAYTEGGSSKANSVILGAINNRYHRKIFEAATWICFMRSAGLTSPTRVAEKLWRGEALFEGTIYPK